jgi:EF hand
LDTEIIENLEDNGMTSDEELPTVLSGWGQLKSGEERENSEGGNSKRRRHVSFRIERREGIALTIITTRQWASDNTSNTKGGTKMKWIIGSAALFITMAILSPGFTAGLPEKNIREAYKMILSQADTNKDGKLSVAECMAGYKDKSMAEKNCTFWDADKDGIITEDEYVKQVSNLGKKK